MLDLNPLLEFSQTHCIAICAVLVPANLLATLQTLLLAWFRRPMYQIHWTTTAAMIYALLLISHVVAWWSIGVVMLPTYILSLLGSVCIVLNLGAIWFRRSQYKQQWTL